MEIYEISFTERVAIFEAPNPWYFVELPKKESSLIRTRFRHVHRGWGSIPVTVQIGDTSWKTSIFWQKKETYLLFIKKEVRGKENITNGDIVKISLLINSVV